MELGAQLQDIARRVALTGELLDGLARLGLNQCHLVAGCLFQAVWNHQAGWPLDQGIKDWDVFYWDPDTSWEAEDRVIRQLAERFGPAVEVRNQARVHLWYGAKHGVERPALLSAEEAIGSFLVECTCVGINVASGRLVAPYGLEDLFAGRLVANQASSGTPAMFAAKSQSYQARWPWLTVAEGQKPA